MENKETKFLVKTKLDPPKKSNIMNPVTKEPLKRTSSSKFVVMKPSEMKKRKDEEERISTKNHQRHQERVKN